MTPRAYQAARALAVDPGATPAERANAAQRCAEYKASHPDRPDGGIVWNDDFSRNLVPGSELWLIMQAVAAQRAIYDDLIRRRQTHPRTATIPWWTLKIAPRTGTRAGRWMGNTAEFRAVLRGEKRGTSAIGDYQFCHYTGDAATLEALNSGEVDWTHFPDREAPGSRWRPPAEVRAAVKKNHAEPAA
jgi:hypothetical protein